MFSRSLFYKCVCSVLSELKAFFPSFEEGTIFPSNQNHFRHFHFVTVFFSSFFTTTFSHISLMFYMVHPTNVCVCVFLYVWLAFDSSRLKHFSIHLFFIFSFVLFACLLMPFWATAFHIFFFLHFSSPKETFFYVFKFINFPCFS